MKEEKTSPFEMKAWIRTNPGHAAKLLREAFVKLGSRREVARHYSVAESTVDAWIKRLGSSGFSDPRHEARTANPNILAPRARRHPLLAAADRDPEGTKARILKAMHQKPGESSSVARARAAKKFRCSEITIRRVLEKLDNMAV